MTDIDRIYVYRAGEVWCYAAYAGGYFDHGDTINISADADERTALDELAWEWPQARIVRVADVTAESRWHDILNAIADADRLSGEAPSSRGGH